MQRYTLELPLIQSEQHASPSYIFSILLTNRCDDMTVTVSMRYTGVVKFNADAFEITFVRSYWVRIDCTDRVAWSVGLSITDVNPAKMAEPIEMPFGLWTRVGLLFSTLLFVISPLS